MGKLNIQYTSDLHIDNYPSGTPFESFVTPVAPVLVIAGDICSVWKSMYVFFLEWCSKHWSHVIVVTGNHEYFCDPSIQKTIDQTDVEARRICSLFPNVHFLQSGESYVVPETSLRFVGATLWTAIEPSVWEDIRSKKGDFVHTYSQGMRKTHPSDICAIHALHKAHLRSAIAPQRMNETLIVVTHHMPSQQLLDKSFRNHRLRSCYASNDDDLFAPNIRVWICGHSHRALQWQSPGPLCVMNARGYNQADERERTEGVYNPVAMVSVEIESRERVRFQNGFGKN